MMILRWKKKPGGKKVCSINQIQLKKTLPAGDDKKNARDKLAVGFFFYTADMESGSHCHCAFSSKYLAFT